MNSKWQYIVYVCLFAFLTDSCMPNQLKRSKLNSYIVLIESTSLISYTVHAYNTHNIIIILIWNTHIHAYTYVIIYIDRYRYRYNFGNNERKTFLNRALNKKGFFFVWPFRLFCFGICLFSPEIRLFLPLFSFSS